MLVVGLVLLLLGFFLAIPALETVGIIVTVVGLVLFLIGAAGHTVGPRRYWW